MNAKNNTSELEIHYQLFRILENNNAITQRELAHQMGISLGKVNFCLSQLAETGMIRIKRFKDDKNKKKYIYSLTPKGIEEKIVLTVRFLKRKQAEYDAIKKQIQDLTQELEQSIQMDKI